MGLCGRIVRVLVALLLIIISIIISASLIGVCTLASSSYNCANYDTTTTLAQAQASTDKNLIYCYCAGNLVSLAQSTPGISTLCKDLSKTILLTNVVQTTASVVSTVTNALIVIIVKKIVALLIRPETKTTEYSLIFVVVLICNFVNSTVLPLLVNGDIFSFRINSYLRFLKFIDFAKVAIFSDFNRDWYALISPYYTNMFIVAIIVPIVMPIVSGILHCISVSRWKKKCENRHLNPVIQKEANAALMGNLFDLPVETAAIVLNLILCMLYCSLIPVVVPLFAVGLFFIFHSKKHIILKYCRKTPGDSSISQKVITVMPFILLFHFLFAVWSHTSSSLWAPGNQLFALPAVLASYLSRVPAVLQRATNDLLMLGALAIVVLWIVINYTIVAFFSFLCDVCKSELEMPLSMAKYENVPYTRRVQKLNIYNSYRI